MTQLFSDAGFEDISIENSDDYYLATAHIHD
jgi:hypothetical protein